MRVNKQNPLQTTPRHGKTMGTIVSTLQAALELTAGCTEPAAIAYCASFAGKYLGEEPVKFSLKIDQRTYKNAFGVGIPGANERRGTKWALAIGFVMACPENRLSIFSELDAITLEHADHLHDKDIIEIELLEIDGLFIQLLTAGKNHKVETTIEAGHTNVVQLRVDDKDIEYRDNSPAANSPADYIFTDDVYEPGNWSAIIDDLYTDQELQRTIRQSIAYNMAAALHGKKYINMGDDQLEHLVMGAIYARMNGDPIPIMSCAGSGNKGLTCIIPVVAHARDLVLGEEKEIKAVLVSVLLTTIITSRFGEVSSVCGAQYAAGAGVIGGILYLKNELALFNGSYNNFISAIGGGFCDGAKGSCSMRGNVAVATALSAINHSLNGFTVSSRDGFLGQNFKQTLDNLAKYNPLVAQFEFETIKILQDK